MISRFLAGPKGRARRETLSAYLFLLPAILIIFVFGLWPVAHALYVSLHKWSVKPKGSQCFSYWLAQAGIGSPEALKRTDCLGLDNYVELLGWQNVSAVLGMAAGLVLGLLAYRWGKRARQSEGRAAWRWAGTGILVVASAYFLVRSVPGLIRSGEWTYLVSIGLFLLAWLIWKGASHADSTLRLILRLLGATALISAALFMFFVDFQRIWESGTASDPVQMFWKSMIYTVFYSVGTVPIQLGLSLLLAYILFQGIRAQGAFRLLYFMPYIAPSVATAVVFRRVFTLRDTGLMNQLMSVLHLPTLKWLHEPRGVNIVLLNLFNQAFGTSLAWPQISDPLNVILSGPSLALVSIIIYNWWVFVGYDTVIYLAGLGNIPGELYEAAEIDGAGRWALLRKITFPLLSPTTFFLTVIATIGTFKAFNHIWIMREEAARDTVETTTLLIFQVFRGQGQFGEAAAMSFILFAAILVLSQIQNRVGEKLVFYG
jgi:ABC-type sugar transport system permease subunit